MKPSVIFIDTVHPVLYERLEEAGYNCEWKSELNRSQVLAIISNYEGAVIRSKFRFDQEVFDQATNLKWLARSGAGMENIDLKVATEKHVKCFNSPEGNRDAVAEHALGMLLSLFNNLNRSDIEVRNGMWNREQNRGIELKGKTVGLLGYGYMGEAFAQRLRGFDVTCIAYDKYKKNFGNDFVEEVSLEDLMTRTEVLSVHLPLTEETSFLINKDFLEQFQHNIYLINTARGKNLNTADLLETLASGKVIGACLDVLEFEKTSFENLDKATIPETFQQLITNDRVILSPHVAGWTKESYFKLSNILADKILSEFPTS